MIPQRDYSDFTKYVNENQAAAKESLLSRTMRTDGFRTGMGLREPKTTKNDSNFLTHSEVDTLMSRTDADFFKSQHGGPKR